MHLYRNEDVIEKKNDEDDELDEEMVQLGELMKDMTMKAEDKNPKEDID